DSTAPARPRRHFSLLVTLICSAVVAVYVGLPLGPLVTDTSPATKLERPQESLDRLVTRELDLHRVMRPSSPLEWRPFPIMTGGGDPAREAADWSQELAELPGSTPAELHRAILLAEAGDRAAAEQGAAEWREGSPPAARMARWIAAAYLDAPLPAGEGQELI